MNRHRATRNWTTCHRDAMEYLRRRVHRRPLEVERLEPRQLLNGNVDVWLIDDSAETLAHAYTVAGNAVQRDGTALVSPAPFQAIVIKGGSAADQFNVTSSQVGIPVTLEGNGGDDAFTVAAGNLDAIAALVVARGGIGASDRLVVNDSGSAAVVDYLVTPYSVTSARSDQAPSSQPARTFAGIHYDGSMEFLRLDGTDGANVFDVQPAWKTAYSIDGNLPVSGAVAAASGDFLKLDTETTGTSGRSLAIASRGAGSWTFASDHQPVQFESIEKFNHVGIVAVGADAGKSSKPRVRVFDAETGELKFEIPATLTYGNTYRNGVRVATGDLDNDGLPDVAVAPGRLQAPDIKVFNGAPTAGVEGTEIAGLRLAATGTLGATFKGGVQLAIGDVNGDGLNDVALAADSGPALIKVFTAGGPGSPSLSLARSFNAFADYPKYIGGATVAVADLDGSTDGNARGDILVGSGPGLPAMVRVFDVTANAATYKALRQIADPKRGRNGVFVATGDASGDGIPDIITGAGPGGASYVRVYNGLASQGNAPMASFRAFTDRSSTAPIRVTARDTDGDGSVEIFAAQGADGRNNYQVRQFHALTGALVDAFFATHRDFYGGGVWLG